MEGFYSVLVAEKDPISGNLNLGKTPGIFYLDAESAAEAAEDIYDSLMDLYSKEGKNSLSQINDGTANVWGVFRPKDDTDGIIAEGIIYDVMACQNGDVAERVYIKAISLSSQ